MADLLNLTFEGGDTSQVDTEFTSNGGSITASTASAQEGTNYGVDLVSGGAASTAILAQTDFTYNTDDVRVRFYVDFTALTMADGDQFDIIRVKSPSGSTNRIRAMVLYTLSGDVHSMSFGLKDDAGSWTDSSEVTIPNGKAMVEIHAIRGTGVPVSDNNAELRIYINGSTTKEPESLDATDAIDLVDTWGINEFRFGSLAGVDAGTTGSFYMDEIKATDDSARIGPVTFSDGIRPRHSGADYNSTLQSRYGPYGGRYR